MKPQLDHIVIGAKTLEQGVVFVKNVMGVEMPFGGVHRQMGTHNHLMQLGKDVFLEVIAVDPDGDRIERPRWYGLDDPFVKERIERQPRNGFSSPSSPSGRNLSAPRSSVRITSGRPSALLPSDCSSVSPG